MARKAKSTNRQGPRALQLKVRAGAYLKGLRSDVGLTQLELSKKLGYDYYSFISQVEQGVARVPPDSYKLWADALEVDVSEFVKTLLEFYEPEMYEAIFHGK